MEEEKVFYSFFLVSKGMVPVQSSMPHKLGFHYTLFEDYQGFQHQLDYLIRFLRFVLLQTFYECQQFQSIRLELQVKKYLQIFVLLQCHYLLILFQFLHLPLVVQCDLFYLVHLCLVFAKCLSLQQVVVALVYHLLKVNRNSTNSYCILN